MECLHFFTSTFEVLLIEMLHLPFWHGWIQVFYQHPWIIPLSLSSLLGHMCIMLGTYVNIFFCNWLILWQNALYLYLGRFRMCLILQETMLQVQVIEAMQICLRNKWRKCWILKLNSSQYLSIARLSIETLQLPFITFLIALDSYFDLSRNLLDAR